MPSNHTTLFASFNQQYKVDRRTLRAWATILTLTNNSALWLLRFRTSDAAEPAIVHALTRLGVLRDQVRDQWRHCTLEPAASQLYRNAHAPAGAA